MRKSKAALSNDIFHLHVHLGYLERLVDLFNDEGRDFEMSDYQHKSTVSKFERAHDVISMRIATLEHALENYDDDPRIERGYFGKLDS